MCVCVRCRHVSARSARDPGPTRGRFVALNAAFRALDPTEQQRVLAGMARGEKEVPNLAATELPNQTPRLTSVMMLLHPPFLSLDTVEGEPDDLLACLLLQTFSFGFCSGISCPCFYFYHTFAPAVSRFNSNVHIELTSRWFEFGTKGQ